MFYNLRANVAKADRAIGGFVAPTAGRTIYFCGMNVFYMLSK